jgi:hypothetical protein
VKVDGKDVPVETYWKKSPDRDEKTLVVKPGGTAEPHEYNLWRGFGIEARKGWQKQRRFLRHLLKVVCQRNKEKFKYLMRLLAWFVQNPDKQAGVVLVLKSREEGTGKSTVSRVMPTPEQTSGRGATMCRRPGTGSRRWISAWA